MNLEILGHIIQSSLDNRSLKNFIGKYYQPYYDVINMLAYDSPPGVFVELGVEKGRGCEAALLADKIEVIGIDLVKRDEISNIENKYPLFTFLENASMPAPEQIEDKKISILHIDTEHSLSMARGEFYVYKQYLTNPAVVLFDDLHACDDGVMEFFASLSYPKIQDDRLHPSCGYGVVLYVE